MSRLSERGKREWRLRGSTYADELTAQITADAEQRMATWAARGSVPWWIRLKAWLRGRPIRV